MRSNRFVYMMIVSVMLVGLLAGCSAGGNESKENVKTSLKVMHYDERSFYQQYGMLFSTLYPNIEIEVVSTQSVPYEEGKDMQKAIQEFIAQEKPDVLMLSTDEYSRMSSEGKLYNLESFIKKDKYDLEGFAPGVIEYIKQQSDGILYGLVPEFYSQAIYYNKDLFAKHGVTLPEDRMSWEKLLQLAARFPTTGSKDDRVYGLKVGYQSDLYQLGMMIGSSQGLTYIKPSSMQLMINSDSWKTAFETANTALKSGSLYVEDPNQMNGGSSSYEDYLLRDPFIGGKVAMVMEGSYLMNQIKEAKNVLKDKGKGVQNWDLVTVPVNPQTPDESTYMSLNQIFAIDANTANADAAWKFVSYINGDDYARVTSKLQNGSFPTRTKYLDNGDGLHMEAFYSLKPAQNNMYKDFDKIPQQFYMKFDGLTQQEFQSVKDGKTTISEALDRLQTKGQQMLTEESEKEAKAKATAGEASPSPSSSPAAEQTEAGASAAAASDK
ncbi:ABC transporter substrate-binding protein [Cohnella cholangitidis]|uniref:Carbohydrate ABC transporter substrate-binding protein n=1 Tax=Cohnella cholangitidis TaxID=2598458 RepID=A0A7G5BXV9_9BACL|nr:ABC transporter substrate-binding protein [Cohnella cholangitidis]QMV41793.1 carbohydrate ABC transporter substrate-binding protein [Cohnella cholangitidis]